jgi:hypothetical protein
MGWVIDLTNSRPFLGILFDRNSVNLHSLTVKLSMQALAVLLLLTSLLIPCWHAMINHVERHMNLNTLDFHSKLVSEIDEKAKFLHPINSSATNLARVLASSLNGSADQLSFSEIETRVCIIYININFSLII